MLLDIKKRAPVNTQHFKAWFFNQCCSSCWYLLLTCKQYYYRKRNPCSVGAASGWRNAYCSNGQHRVSNIIDKGSILFLKWITKDYTGCRTWKSTTHIIRQYFMISLFSIKHNACMSGACFCPYSWSTVLVCGRAEGWKERNSQGELTLVNKEVSLWRRDSVY